MLVVIKTEIIEENGQEYEVRTYSNGTVVKEIILPEVEVEPVEPVEPEPTQLDRIEEQLNALTADIVTLANVENAILEGVNEV